MLTIIWLAAGGVAFLLLFALDFLVAALSSRRRDVGMRLFRLVLLLLLLALTTVPAAAFWLWGGAGNAGGALLFYLVFFGVFCYYLGRRMGRGDGEARIRELMGLDSFSSVEEALDRLFESRLRHPSRIEVVQSIGVLAKREEVAKLEEERRLVGRPAAEPAPNSSEAAEATPVYVSSLEAAEAEAEAEAEEAAVEGEAEETAAEEATPKAPPKRAGRSDAPPPRW